MTSTETPLQTLIASLTSAERSAIEILQLSIASYNAADGIGLFTGPSRYAVLTDRARLAAVKCATFPLTRFWSELLRSMRWPLPPKRVDDQLIPILAAADAGAVLRAVADNAPSLVMLARALNDLDRAARKAARDVEDDLIPEGSLFE